MSTAMTNVSLATPYKRTEQIYLKISWQYYDKKHHMAENRTCDTHVTDYAYNNQWRIQEFRGFCSKPPPDPVFKYPMIMKQFGLNETKLFHFHGIFRKNEMKSAKRTPIHLYI